MSKILPKKTIVSKRIITLIRIHREILGFFKPKREEITCELQF